MAAGEMLGVGRDIRLDMNDLDMPGQDGDGRRRRFEVLYAQHYARVLGYVLRRIDSPDQAADVLAETFLVAWRRLGERRRTQLADRLRAEVSARGPIGEPPGAGTAAAVAFRSLRDEDRELLTLRGWEGLDAGEIAGSSVWSSAPEIDEPRLSSSHPWRARVCADHAVAGRPRLTAMTRSASASAAPVHESPGRSPTLSTT
jgi:Sigma-70 region 2